MKQKISSTDRAACAELRHCARAARARRGTPRKPHGAVRQSLRVTSSAGRADRSVADASHAAARHPGKAASFDVRQSLQLAKASRERTMGGQDAWVTRKQSSRDATAMPGVREVRSRKTILRRDRRNAHTRAFPARTRGVVFSCDGLLHTRVLLLTRALPTPARLPHRSPRQQPLSGLNTAHLEVRHASFGFRDRLMPHAQRLRRIPAPPPRRAHLQRRR